MNILFLFFATLLTPWGGSLNSNIIPLVEYPRPQFQRKDWINLNGVWDYTIKSASDDALPQSYLGKILVPFPIESELSGVKCAVGADQQLWYRRMFKAPVLKNGERLMLHFEAVDWQAKVYLNGVALRRHQGGYDAFSIDITGTIKSDSLQELVLSVSNPVDAGSQPRGKQQLKPSGIMYTAVTGIWQTVWLEIIPSVNISELMPIADLDAGKVIINLSIQAPAGVSNTAHIQISDHGKVVAQTDYASEGRSTTKLELSLPDVHAWSPKDPFLYDVKAILSAGSVTDTVTTYFGVRKIEVCKASDGFTRIFLNNQPLFLIGPLDQGWWPDGLYTAPSDEALKWDVETMRKLGFNLVRKHVKIEPARWYYHCDTVGILVFQDFPSGFRAGAPSERIGRDDVTDGIFGHQESAQFRRELSTMISQHSFFPSIVAWVPFNEGWGQHDTNGIVDWVKRLDPSRLVDGPSGWNDLGMGDMLDKHQYPGPGAPIAQPARASILGEFGGLGLPVTGHLWQENKNWGYRNMKSQDELFQHYAALISQIPDLIKKGLNAAIYTQITDVETEVNGLITYDRKVIKVPVSKVAELNQSLTDHR